MTRPHDTVAAVAAYRTDGACPPERTGQAPAGADPRARSHSVQLVRTYLGRVLAPFETALIATPISTSSRAATMPARPSPPRQWTSTPLPAATRARIRAESPARPPRTRHRGRCNRR